MQPARAPLTDSPWFWAYLFGTAALVALALLTPKYGPRQAQLEREFQGRQRAAQNQRGQEPSIALSSAERLIVTLRPLFLGLAALTVLAWIVFWVRRQREGAAQEGLPPGKPLASSESARDAPFPGQRLEDIP